MAVVPLVSSARKREVVGVGRVIVWPAGSLWVGRHVGNVPEHAHHAIQISLAIEGRFRVQAHAWTEARETAGMVVMPDRRHRMDGCNTTMATLFVEPNSAAGAALRTRFDGQDVAMLPDEEAEVAASGLGLEYLAGAADHTLVQLAQDAICSVAGNPLVAVQPDRRITVALEWMRSRLEAPIRLQEVAQAVHLSPGRFRHLFVAQTGTTFRAWLLWARAEHAIVGARAGMSWTAAAQTAGFADAAHFTRTCRRVFGTAPTMLVFE